MGLSYSFHPQDLQPLAPICKKCDIHLEQDIKTPISSSEIVAVNDQMLMTNEDHFSTFQQIISSLFSLLTKPPSVIPTSKNHPWFDQECKLCRSRLRSPQSDLKLDITQGKIIELAIFAHSIRSCPNTSNCSLRRNAGLNCPLLLKIVVMNFFGT